jgi:hypothetical protein
MKGQTPTSATRCLLRSTSSLNDRELARCSVAASFLTFVTQSLALDLQRKFCRESQVRKSEFPERVLRRIWRSPPSFDLGCEAATQ